MKLQLLGAAARRNSSAKCEQSQIRVHAVQAAMTAVGRVQRHETMEARNLNRKSIHTLSITSKPASRTAIYHTSQRPADETQSTT